MNKTNITILRSSPYVMPSSQARESVGKEVVTFEELKGWVNSGKIFKHFFRYEESILWAYDLKLIPKPFWTTVLVRLLARRGSWMIDRLGARKPINFSLLLHYLGNLIRDSFGIRSYLQSIESEIRDLSLSNESVNRGKLDLSLPAVYLRTDLVFGLRSGGSVGHIAGVLNQLDQYSEKPVFLTTDQIPTVRGDLEVHIVLPDEIFWDFGEVQPISFSNTFYEKALKILEGKKISFVYQRYSLNNYSGVKLARMFKIPFVLEYNGSEIWVNRNWGTPLKYEKLAEENEVLNLKACDVVVVVSRPLKDELVGRGVESNKILVNPNGVDPESYSPSIVGTEVRKKNGLEDKVVLGFIGTFGRWHGAEVLAETFGELLTENPSYRQKVRLLMIGDGGTMALVKETLAKVGAEKEVLLTGTLPQAEGPPYLAACDLLVAPHVPNPDGTRFFGSPTKLFEYMAMGKGIVASDLDQIGEILKHNETAWMVKPGDKDSLKAGLKILIEDKTLRDRLGRAAREECVAKYTWKEHTRKIIEKLKERDGGRKQIGQPT